MDTPLPKHVQIVKRANGRKKYFYNPPQRLVDLELAKRQTVGTITKARRLSEEGLRAYEEYKKEHVRTLNKSSTLTQVVNKYKETEEYNNLVLNTKKSYDYMWRVCIEDFRNCKVKDLDSKKAKFWYDKWCERGIDTANRKVQVMRLLFNYLMYQELVYINPFTNVKKRKPPPRKIVWEQEQILKFLDTCFSEYRFRNLGLICSMAYEWGQRIGDMRTLKWDRFNEDFTMLHLEQSKTHAEVFLPISEDLRAMLIEQKKEFGWTGWVAPNHRKKRGYHHPYSREHLGMIAREAMRKAGLPEELQIKDIRRTVVTEMVEAGVPIPQLMATTGHVSPASLAPYIKHTYDSANAALTQRLNYKKGKIDEF